MSLLCQLTTSRSVRLLVARVLVLLLVLLPGLSGGTAVPKSGATFLAAFEFSAAGLEATLDPEEEHVHLAPGTPSRRAFQRRLPASSVPPVFLLPPQPHGGACSGEQPWPYRVLPIPLRDPHRWSNSRRGPPTA